jgi:hypothetical protein
MEDNDAMVGETVEVFTAEMITVTRKVNITPDGDVERLQITKEGKGSVSLTLEQAKSLSKLLIAYFGNPE